MILYSITDFNPSQPDDYFYLTHKNTTYAVGFFYTFVATLEMLESCVIGCFVPFCMNCGISGRSCNRFRTHKSAIFKIGIFLKVSELHFIFLYFRWKQKLLRGIARSVSIRYDFQRNNFITYTRKNNNNDLKTSWIFFLER